MKKSLIFLAVFLSVSQLLFAGAKTTIRNNCTIFAKKYRCDVYTFWGACIPYAPPSQQSTSCYSYCTKGASHCSSINISCTLYAPYSPGTVVAYAKGIVSNGSVQSNTMTTQSAYKAGLGYFNSSPEEDGIEGYSESDFFVDRVQHLGNNQNGRILLKDISGKISALDQSRFGSLFRVIIWKPNDHVDNNTGDYVLDTTITSKKIFWEASVRIENGQVFFTGGFEPSDFLAYNSEKILTIQTTGLTQTIGVVNLSRKENRKDMAISLNDARNQLLINNPRQVPDDVIYASVNELAVTIETEAGYGDYQDIYKEQTTIHRYAQKEPFLNVNSLSKEVVINPDKLNINTVISVFSIDGRTLSTIELANFSDDQPQIISLSDMKLSSGVYIIRATRGEAIESKRIFIE